MMVGLKAVGRPKRGFMSGGSSTRKGARPTATGKRALTLKRFASGGMNETGHGAALLHARFL